MCAAIHLLAGHLNHAIVVIAQQQTFHLARAKRIHPLADHRQGAILAQGSGADARGDAGNVLNQAYFWLTVIANHLTQLGDMGGTSAAAAADHRYTVLAHKLADDPPEGVWLHRIDCLAIHLQRQTRVGKAGNWLAGVSGEVLDSLAHMLRAG